MNYEQAKKHVTKKEITDLARELEQVHSDVLTAWDRAALHKVSEIELAMEFVCPQGLRKAHVLLFKTASSAS